MTRLLANLRSLARPSAIARILWIAVAALHGWLILRRLSFADFGWADALRAFLCVAAVAYATLKIWRVATALDRSPRRAWAFALLVLVLHWGVSVTPDSLTQQAGARAIPALIAAAPVFYVLMQATSHTKGEKERVCRLPHRHILPLRAFDFDLIMDPILHDFPSLFRRPPPLAV